jgi:hypothetical protein
MHPSLQPLQDRAFHRAAAPEANAAIARARELAGSDEPHSYEVVVGAQETLAELAQRVLPRLVYHLESRGARAPEFAEIFFSLFAGDALLFVHARDAMPLLADAVHLSQEQLVERFGTGELRRAMQPGEAPPPEPSRAPLTPLLLPDKPKP